MLILGIVIAVLIITTIVFKKRIQAAKELVKLMIEYGRLIGQIKRDYACTDEDLERCNELSKQVKAKADIIFKF